MTTNSVNLDTLADRLGWPTARTPEHQAVLDRARALEMAPRGCSVCGERHNPERVSCSAVRGVIDGLSPTNPEGATRWADPRPAMPVTPSELDPGEWEL